MASDHHDSARRAPGANAHVGEYLCHAWGESSCPVAAIKPDRAGVIDFLCSFWFGERPETLHADNREAFDLFMAEFDSDDWDMVDHIEKNFEIGGLRVTKVVDVGDMARRSPPREVFDASAVRRAVADLPNEVALALTLHPATADLVVRFAGVLAKKLALAERKYGYSDGWRDPDNIDEMRQHMIEHVAKGDPLDVAAYCSFLWHHGSSTAAPEQARSTDADAVGIEGPAQ